MYEYKNPKLTERLAEVRIIDRYSRHILGTIEHMLSLAISTDPDQGLVMITLSLDSVVAHHTVAGTLLAGYPMSGQAAAEADARTMGLIYDLAVRKAHSGVGWVALADAPQDIEAAGSDLVIGG